MLYKTRGIVLHSVKYSETSLIVKVYTEVFGLQSYLLKGIRSQKSNIRPAFFQPLSLLNLVVYHREKSTLHAVKEVQLAKPLHTISSDIRKSSIAIFLAELIYRSIREEEANATLFKFLWNSITLLETMEEPVASFHLVFTIKLSRFLGFQPQENRSDSNRFFHLREGTFHPLFSSPDDCLDEHQSAWFFQLMKTDLNHLQQLALPAKIRSILLGKILLYYRFHLPGLKEIHSHEILHAVLS
ncbi:MAG: DNA repair protein RecO [Bacteroidetes bacterium]|nr:MAG: DNA repair protein RecO [Bacteroidota bacterium]